MVACRSILGREERRGLEGYRGPLVFLSFCGFDQGGLAGVCVRSLGSAANLPRLDVDSTPRSKRARRLITNQRRLCRLRTWRGRGQGGPTAAAAASLTSSSQSEPARITATRTQHSVISNTRHHPASTQHPCLPMPTHPTGVTKMIRATLLLASLAACSQAFLLPGAPAAAPSRLAAPGT